MLLKNKACSIGGYLFIRLLIVRLVLILSSNFNRALEDNT